MGIAPVIGEMDARTRVNGHAVCGIGDVIELACRATTLRDVTAVGGHVVI